ncbi:MAG: hypothetical protein ACUVQ0_04825 [Thermoproteota archaeon]
MKPVILYDNLTCDEVGIRIAASKRGIDLDMVNFSTTMNVLNHLDTYSIVINRCQSKARRERAAFILEEKESIVINPFEVETICNSKIFTLAKFVKYGVKTAMTAYIPFAVEKDKERVLYRAGDIDILVRKIEEYFKYPFVIKPERGSRGRNIIRVEGREHLKNILEKWVRNLDSPAGLLVQECLNKSFDIRVVTYSYDGNKQIYLASLARVFHSREAFATNTALGAIPVGVSLPERIRDEAVKAARSVSNRTSVLGVDAIPSISGDIFENIVSQAEKVVQIHNRIMKLKEAFSNSAKLSIEKFMKARENLDMAFKEMMNNPEYIELKDMLENALKEAEIYFIEINSRPDFYINTRNCTGVDISEAYVECIEKMG